MSLSDLIIPVWSALLFNGAAIAALVVMYRMGHNKTILVMLIPELWLFASFLFYALGWIGEAERVTLLRYGFSQLQLAVIIGAVVFWLNRRKS